MIDHAPLRGLGARYLGCNLLALALAGWPAVVRAETAPAVVPAAAVETDVDGGLLVSVRPRAYSPAPDFAA